MQGNTTANFYQSVAPQSQSRSSSSSSSSSSNSELHSCSCRKSSCSRSSSSRNSSSSSSSKIYSYTLIMTLAALLMPLTHARHLADQLAMGYAYDEDASSSSIDTLPAWHPDPFHGLSESFGESNYDNSGSSNVGISAESQSSYEQIAEAAVHAAMRELQGQRMRHRRSHILRLFVKSQHKQAAPEWENPCGGVYIPDDSQPAEVDNSSQGRVVKRKYLIELRNITMLEYRDIRKTANLTYGDFQNWQHDYKFLPNMTRPTNAVKLKTWYRNMQTFVGSFAYLGKAHYKYLKEHQQGLDKRVIELHDLLESAREMLCQIETTINSSYPNSNGAKLSQISREAMMERLRFRTLADGSKEVNTSDLKFSKQLYFQYLDNMWKTLHRSLNRKHHRATNSRERRRQSAGSISVSGFNSLQQFSLESSEGYGSAAAAASAAAER